MVHLHCLYKRKGFSYRLLEVGLVWCMIYNSVYAANHQMQKCDPASSINDGIGTIIVKSYLGNSLAPNSMHIIAITVIVHCSAAMPLIGPVVWLVTTDTICKARCAKSHRSPNVPSCCPVCNGLGTASHSVLGHSANNHSNRNSRRFIH
jgi:hypothetical protein